MNVSHDVISSVSECGLDESWYDCEPCQPVRCGDPHPWLCWSNFGVCKKPGCYCNENFVRNDDGLCIEEIDCFKPLPKDYNKYENITSEEWDNM